MKSEGPKNQLSPIVSGLPSVPQRFESISFFAIVTRVHQMWE